MHQHGLACVEWTDMHESLNDIFALCVVVVVAAIVDCRLAFKMGRRRREMAGRALLLSVLTFTVVFSLKSSLDACSDVMNCTVRLLQSLACAEGVLTSLLLLEECRTKRS